MKQSIRIIGGQYRGKKLSFPAINDLRPTPDRVRETLFNWLMHDIHDARCLDAFAGSGALGFEAFSRGAKEVLFIEQDSIAYDNLKKLCSSFQTPKLSVIKQNACEYIKQQAELNERQFDIAFFDPPFKKPELLDCLAFLDNANLLASGGLIYIESAIEIPLDPSRWKQLKLKQAGQVIYALYQKVP